MTVPSEISENIYRLYLDALLEGDRAGCGRIVEDLLAQGIGIKSLYTDLFQRSLYKVGDLWESNRISVATEHLATAITEGMMGLVYPRLFKRERTKQDRKVVISCTPNELHQVGSKMVADMFELYGWDSRFLGADTPGADILAYVRETAPDLVGLSLSVYFNLPFLKTVIEGIRSAFTDIDIFLGGQAFRWGGIEAIKSYHGIVYIPTLDELEKRLKER